MGGNKGEVFEKGKRTIPILLKGGLGIKKSKVKGPAQEMQFLGVKRQGGCCHITMDVINTIKLYPHQSAGKTMLTHHKKDF